MLGSTINPFATGIASGFAGTSIDEGLVLRLVILVVGTIIGIVWVLRYADRVKANPGRLVVAAQRPRTRPLFQRQRRGRERDAHRPAEGASLALFFLAFAVMIYGVVPWSDIGIPLPTLFWWFPEMTASFLLFSILIWLVEPDEARRRSPTRSWTARATCWVSRSSSGSPAASP